MRNRHWRNTALGLGLAVVALTLGCAQGVYYRYGTKYYAKRAEAEAAHIGELREYDKHMVTSKTNLGYPLFFVIPTRQHVASNLLSPPRPDWADNAYVRSYVESVTMRDIGFDGRLLTRSGLFSYARIMTAEQLASGLRKPSGSAFETRTVVASPRGAKVWGYNFYGPGGQGPAFVSSAEIRRDSRIGWCNVDRRLRSIGTARPDVRCDPRTTNATASSATGTASSASRTPATSSVPPTSATGTTTFVPPVSASATTPSVPPASASGTTTSVPSVSASGTGASAPPVTKTVPRDCVTE